MRCARLSRMSRPMARSSFRPGLLPSPASWANSSTFHGCHAGRRAVRQDRRSTGPPTGQTLLCIHAFADSGLTFVPLFDTPLVEHFRLVAVDLAGFGASPRQDDVLTIAQHAEAVVAVARSLSGARPLGLI